MQRQLNRFFPVQCTVIVRKVLNRKDRLRHASLFSIQFAGNVRKVLNRRKTVDIHPIHSIFSLTWLPLCTAFFLTTDFNPLQFPFSKYSQDCKLNEDPCGALTLSMPQARSGGCDI